MVAYASRNIKEALANGEISPGARLSPTALASQYNLSHIPVREALSSLSATGYVIHRRGKGYFARELSSEDLEDIYRLRNVLEREALVQAIPNLTEDDFAEMSELIEKMSHCLDAESRSIYLELNREFHFIQFRRSGSRRLVRFLNYLWDSASPYSNLGAVTSAKGNAEHKQLLKVLKAGDIDAATEIMGRHRHLRMENVEGWEQSQKP